MSEPIIIKDSHFFLSTGQEIDSIANPLKEHLGVSSLVYQRNYNDGSEIRLTNQPTWTKEFYKQGYYHVSGFEKHPSQYQSGIAVWSSLTHHQPILAAARQFNIDHGITLLQKTADGIEYFFLGSTSDKPQVTNLLLNNLEFLHRFTAYFKEQAAPLLKKAYENRVIIPQKYLAVSSDEQGIPSVQNLKKIDVKNILKVKRFQIDNNLTLSAREISCAKLLLQGKSARLIGEELFLSPRTVETYLQQLKDKLHCQSKVELINTLIELNIQLL